MTLWSLRVVAVAFAIDVVVQPVLAGSYLSGETGALANHEANAGTVSGLALLQVVAAFLYWFIGRGRRWPALVSTALIAVIHLQWAIAYDQMLYVHIPLGVAICCGQVAIAAWTFTPSAKTRRPRKPPVDSQLSPKPSTHSAEETRR